MTSNLFLHCGGGSVSSLLGSIASGVFGSIDSSGCSAFGSVSSALGGIGSAGGSSSSARSGGSGSGGSASSSVFGGVNHDSSRYDHDSWNSHRSRNSHRSGCSHLFFFTASGQGSSSDDGGQNE